MEHIVQFAISIDDERIKNIIEEKAADQIIIDIEKEIKNSLPRKWGYRNEDIDWLSIVYSKAGEIIEESRDEIVDASVKRIAASIPKTKLFKDKFGEIE